VPIATARTILTNLAAADPLFGFACLFEEEKMRNQIAIEVQGSSCTSWVGRDIEKHVPGLYWMTLLPEELANKHGVPLSKVSDIALEHVDLGRGQNLFRFYERPEDWKSDRAVETLLANQPGFFDIEKVRPRFESIRTYAEYFDMPRD